MKNIDISSPKIIWIFAVLIPLLMVIIMQALMYGLHLFSTNILVIILLAVAPSYFLLSLEENAVIRTNRMAIFTFVLIPYAPVIAFPYFLYTACILFKECSLL